MDDAFDVQVRGAGVVGRCLALALARAGLRVALAAGPAVAGEGAEDVRAYALNAASVALLRGLRVGDALAAGVATPVRDMRVEGDRDGAAIEFSAWRQAVDALAWIVDAAALEHELAAAVRFAPNVEAVDREVAAPLVAYCDGRESPGRERLGVEFDRVDYGQRAIAARLVADRPHLGVARQWFGAPDVLALLPLDRPEPGRSYALVWSLPAARAAALAATGAAAFEDELARATGGVAGGLRLASPRPSWPLARAAADVWSGPGWVLVGDAAHLVHPLAGQGLNLGLADVAALAGVLAGREAWRSPGDPKLLRRYARERAAPTRAMLAATDGLWRLFAEPGRPVVELRNRGLDLVDRAGPLKRWLTARALGAGAPFLDDTMTSTRLPAFSPTGLSTGRRRPARVRFAIGLLVALGVSAASAATAADVPEAAIRKALAARWPALSVDGLAPSPVAGLYELRSGDEIYYVDAGGDHLVRGAILDTATHADLTQARLEKLNAIDMSTLPLQDAIVWKQGSGARRMVVFADPNCGFCKRFESDLKQVKDVTVYTFLYPILGGNSPSKSRDIWCAKDNAAVWRAWMIDGTPVPRAMGRCDTGALERNLALGRKHHVSGTPAVVFEDGRRISGALPPAEVERQLRLSRRKA